MVDAPPSQHYSAEQKNVFRLIFGLCRFPGPGRWGARCGPLRVGQKCLILTLTHFLPVQKKLGITVRVQGAHTACSSITGGMIVEQG